MNYSFVKNYQLIGWWHDVTTSCEVFEHIRVFITSMRTGGKLRCFYYFGAIVLFLGLLYLNVGHVLHHGGTMVNLIDIIPHVIVGVVLSGAGVGIMTVSNKKAKSVHV